MRFWKDIYPTTKFRIFLKVLKWKAYPNINGRCTLLRSFMRKWANSGDIDYLYTLSFFWSHWHSDFNTFSSPVIGVLPHSSVDSMLSGIVLIFFNCLRGFSHWIRFLFIDPNSLSSEWHTLLLLIFILFDKVPRMTSILCRFFIVEGWSKINFHISIDDANRIILIFWFDFDDIDLKFTWECGDGNSVSLVQTGEVSELIFKDSFGVIKFNELGEMGSKFNEVGDFCIFFLHIRDKGDGGWRSWF